MYLFFDTETTGLPLDYKAHVHDVDNWPRLVQIAWIAYTDDMDELISRNYIVKPEGFEIPEEAADIHGITDAIANDVGTGVKYALIEFNTALFLADTIVGHGVHFDRKVVGAEFIRLGFEESYQRIKDVDRICTMMKSTKFCGLKKGNRPKWPKLSELYEILFKEELENAHDAMVDITATARCFAELKDRGVL